MALFITDALLVILLPSLQSISIIYLFSSKVLLRVDFCVCYVIWNVWVEGGVHVRASFLHRCLFYIQSFYVHLNVSGNHGQRPCWSDC